MAEQGTPNAQIHDLTPVVEIDRRSYAAQRAALEDHERLKAAKFWARLKVWGPIITLLLGGGGGAGLYFKPDSAPPTLPSDLKHDVKKALDMGEENSRQIRTLGKVTVEGMDYLGRKIDTAFPEVKVVEKPESLKDAEKALEASKLEEKVNAALTTGGPNGM